MKEYYIQDDCQVKGLSKIYEKYFGLKGNGSFVDVGAYDGKTYSNTYGLAIAGWSGICFEPVLPFYLKCKHNLSFNENVNVINLAIGYYESDVTFNIAGAVSTCNQAQLNSEYWKGDYKYSSTAIARMTPLDSALNKRTIVKRGFDLLNVDVEGCETDVLRGFDIEYWIPKMVIVEAQEMHPAKELTLQAPFINKYFKDAGYKKIYCDEINNIYVL